MGSAFTGVHGGWGNKLVSFVIRPAWNKQRGPRQMNQKLELVFYNRLAAACASLSLHLYPLALSSATVGETACVWHCFVHTHAGTHARVHAGTQITRTCVPCALLQNSAAVWSQLSLACVWAGSLESGEGEGDSVSLALLMNVSLPPAHSPRARRHLAPLCLQAPHLTIRQQVPSLVWPHGLATLPVELVSLWFWQRLGFWRWCQSTVKGKQINRS